LSLDIRQDPINLLLNSTKLHQSSTSRSQIFNIFLITFLVIHSANSQTPQLIFNCQFYTSSWTVIGTRYACKATVETFNGGNELSAVRGNHVSANRDADVRMLLIHDQSHMTKAPRNIGGFFPELVGYEIFDAMIMTISSEDFRGLPNLNLINIQKNRLTVLDGNLFANTRRLQFIGFSENLIENIGTELLTGLNQLVTAIFLRNVCIDRQASTPTQINELRVALPILCPPETVTPIPTTVPPPVQGECSAECLEKIERIESDLTVENADLRQKVANHERKIEDLITETANFRNVVGGYEERLKELEKQVREINSRP
jgi:Leucine-rich repeat (LRR) protein